MARFPPLPPLRFWDDLFWRAANVAQRERICVHNPETALAMAHAFLDSDATRSTGPKTVIEAFPGPGMLSRALLTLPEDKLGKLIILEDDPRFLPFLEPLAQADPRVTVLPMSGFDWATYTRLTDGILKDVPKLAYDEGVHPNLHFISHIFMTAQHEQFVSQLYRCIPQKSWLFQYGRVPMSLILGEYGYKRIVAGENDMERCKHSVISQIAAETNLALPVDAMAPFTTHFHPIKEQHLAIERRAVSRRIGSPYSAINVIPHQEQLILSDELDAWDFVIRKLFVQKRTAVSQSIGGIAPGAEYLLKYANQNAPEDKQLDASKTPPALSNEEWTRLIREFVNWPFAPEVLILLLGFL
ncbi:S-adenosyl-L-methionine-dependent methyltransferase [Peniophora sp. CONT]|nr:S-adenosyl-L-methionine-dependent methyltransferase [Peniophora sp. CONT]